MSVHQSWNVNDLARCAKVSPEQIEDWIEADLLKATVDSTGILRLPITESVAAFALRDGEDPHAARHDLMKGRDLFRVTDEPIRLSAHELEEMHYSFLARNRLPYPDCTEIDDPREEAV